MSPRLPRRVNSLAPCAQHHPDVGCGSVLGCPQGGFAYIYDENTLTPGFDCVFKLKMSAVLPGGTGARPEHISSLAAG